MVESNNSVGEVKKRKIDIHTHIIPENMPDWNKEFGYDGWLSIHREDHQFMMMKKNGGKENFRRISCNCYDPLTRLNEMSNTEVESQILSCIPGVGFNYFAKAQDAAKVCVFLNDHLAAVVAAHGNNDGPSSLSKYYGLATLPMQDSLLAIEEMRRCLFSKGLHGIIIGTSINDWNLDNEHLDVFWKAVNDWKVPVFIHPWNMPETGRWTDNWSPWLIGMPCETTLAMLSIMNSGLLLKYPDLKLCFAHGGGSFPGTIGRLDHGFRCRPDLRSNQSEHIPRPSIQAKNVWVDSLVHDKRILGLLLDVFGEDKIMIGSDYPFPLGELNPPGAVIDEYLSEAAAENDAERIKSLARKLYFENAIKFFNIQF